MEEIAKGKRGIVYVTEIQGKKYAVKKVNPKSESLSTLEKEAFFLKKVNAVGIGPAFLSLKNNELMMEYIDGVRILDYFQDKKITTEMVLKVISNVLKQCEKLDSLGINKFEMTNPYKHVLVKNKDCILIDFERARFTEKPKNVTQFLQFLSSKKVSLILNEKNIVIDAKKIQELSKLYKKSKNLKTILSYF